MLKHNLRTSEKVASWPIEIRYFWVLLWGYLDDHGKGKDNPLLIKSDCFPLDVAVTGDTIDEWLWVLAGSGVVARYSADGQHFIQAVNWKEHQKPPHPTDDVLPSFNDPHAEVRELHASRMKDAEQTHAPLTPVLGRDWVKSGSGFVNGSSPAVMEPKPDLDAEFELAWAHWPKKVERKAALEKYKQAIKKVRWDFLLDAIQRFGDAYAATTEKQFTPALGVWLAHERWTDELPVAPVGKRPPTRTEQNLDTVALYRAAENQRQEIES